MVTPPLTISVLTVVPSAIVSVLPLLTVRLWTVVVVLSVTAVAITTSSPAAGALAGLQVRAVQLPAVVDVFVAALAMAAAEERGNERQAREFKERKVSFHRSGWRFSWETALWRSEVETTRPLVRSQQHWGKRMVRLRKWVPGRGGVERAWPPDAPSARAGLALLSVAVLTICRTRLYLDRGYRARLGVGIYLWAGHDDSPRGHGRVVPGVYGGSPRAGRQGRLAEASARKPQTRGPRVPA